MAKPYSINNRLSSALVSATLFITVSLFLVFDYSHCTLSRQFTCARLSSWKNICQFGTFGRIILRCLSFFNLAFSAPLGIFLLLSILFFAISALSLTHTTALMVSVCLHGNGLGHARERARSDNRKRHILMINSNLVLLAWLSVTR